MPSEAPAEAGDAGEKEGEVVDAKDAEPPKE
jgi:hypothetical protein